MNQTRAPSYRADLDGLRAVAVLAVVGFHAGIGKFHAGFMGVDIFFVISGYLISGIIFPELEKGSFTFKEFYARRIRRIFPALVASLAVTAILGWTLLYPHELVLLGRQILAGTTFTSNFLFWSEAGYFDSTHKPLLHLWSLAIEEQFYLAWPLIAWIAWRRKWNPLAVGGAIVVLSFSAGIIAITRSQGIAAFFSPVTRIWEIIIGGALFLYESKRQPSRTPSNLLSITGAILLAIGMVTISSETPWPGWLALLPVFGTLFLIAAGSEGWINKRILSNPGVVGVGLISYPLYLWHWPLLVFARLCYGDLLSRPLKAGIVLVALVLAWLTYRFVESPIRLGKSPVKSVVLLAPSMAVMASISIAILSGALTPRLGGSRVAKIESAIDDINPRGGLGPDGKIDAFGTAGDDSGDILVIGDSHAAQYFARFEELHRQKKLQGDAIFMTYGGCPPLPGVNHRGISWDGAPYRCDDVYVQALERARAPDVETVVYSAWWDTYLDTRALYFADDPQKRPLTASGVDSVFRDLATDIAGLEREGKEVFIVLSNPVSESFDPLEMLPPRIPGDNEHDSPVVSRAEEERERALSTQKLRAIAAKTGAEVIDPFETLCDAKECDGIDDSGAPVYRDYQHLRNSFVRNHATFIDRIIAR